MITRLSLLLALFALIAAMAWLFQRVGLGEIGVILAVLAVAFSVEIVRYVVKQFLRGYRAPPQTTGTAREKRERERRS